MQLKINDFQDVMLEALEENNEFLLPICGTSMEPFIHTGDKALIKKSDSYKKRDVILYRRQSGQFVFHRILKRKKDFFLVTGDNQIDLEEVKMNQIKGKMVQLIQNNKVVNHRSLFYRFKIWVWSNRIYRRVYWKLFGRKYLKK